MIQKRLFLMPVLVALILAVGAGAASAAKAGSQVFEGLVRHVSASDIKVYNPTTKLTQAFVIVPRFGNVFKANGQTPAQVKDIAAGQYVKVYYDQKLLGARHADRILIMTSNNVPVATKKS